MSTKWWRCLQFCTIQLWFTFRCIDKWLGSSASLSHTKKLYMFINFERHHNICARAESFLTTEVYQPEYWHGNHLFFCFLFFFLLRSNFFHGDTPGKILHWWRCLILRRMLDARGTNQSMCQWPPNTQQGYLQVLILRRDSNMRAGHI